MTAPTHVERTLPNGLRLLIEHNPSSPATTVCLAYGVGSRHEQTTRTGLAHLFEHLMFRGAARAAAGEYDRLLESVGGSFNAMTSTDWTVYFATVPQDAVDLLLWLEADRLDSLADVVDAAALDLERDVVKNERRQRVDDAPYGSMFERTLATMFPPGHPYHHDVIGFMDDLEAASLDDVKNFFAAHYVPSNLQVVVVGDLEPERVIASVERHLGAVAAGQSAPAPSMPVLSSLRDCPDIVIDGPEPTPKLAYFWRLPPGQDDGVDAAEAALALLAGGTSTRLVSELVRGEEVAVAVESGMDRRFGNSLAVLEVMAAPGVDLARLRSLTDAALTRLATEPPTQDEVDRVVAGLRRARAERDGTTAGRALELGFAAAAYGDPHLVDRWADRLENVTAEQIRAAVALMLAPDLAQCVLYPALGAGDGADENEGVL